MTSAKQAATRARRLDDAHRRLGRRSAGRADALGSRDHDEAGDRRLRSRTRSIALRRARARATRSSRGRRRRSSSAGLHRLCVPGRRAGSGPRWPRRPRCLLALGAVDGSTALGFAMQVHVTGRCATAPAVPTRSAIASTARSSRTARSQQRGDRGGRRIAGAWRDPGHDGRARPTDGTWRLTGEKTWTTWLPNLRLRVRHGARRRGRGPGRRSAGSSWISPRTGSSAARGSRRWGCAARRPGGSS